MYQAVAREYIPGGENFTDEQVDEVGYFLFLAFLDWKNKPHSFMFLSPEKKAKN